MGRRALVTGASGFVGRALCAALHARGDQVRAVMRRPAAGPWDEQWNLDLGATDLPTGLVRDVDVVWHLAARSRPFEGLAAAREPGGLAAAREPRQPELAEERAAADLAATRALLDAAAAAGAPALVFASSVRAVGLPVRGPADERTATPPDTGYGRAKRAAEELVLAAAERHGLHACVVRPAPVYGPGCGGGLRRMLRAVDQGRFPAVPEVGNRRSLVGLDDLVAALLLVAERPEAAGRTYVVCDGQAYSTRRVQLAMAGALGRTPPARTVPAWALRALARTGDLASWLAGRPAPFDSAALRQLLGSAWYSAARISAELGWRPRQDLEGALPAMVAAYREEEGS
ncbi:MAG TPA: NAD-dependent epimerase/dehydratase family protein [Actinomycetes bacterium]